MIAHEQSFLHALRRLGPFRRQLQEIIPRSSGPYLRVWREPRVTGVELGRQLTAILCEERRPSLGLISQDEGGLRKLCLHSNVYTILPRQGEIFTPRS